MKLGVIIDDRSDFVADLLTDWKSRYQTDVFAFRDLQLPVGESRINRWRLKQTLQRFLDKNQVVFFEWAGPRLITASRIPSRASLVVRLWSYELYAFAPHIQWDTVQQIILTSDAMKKRFSELYPNAAEKVVVIRQGRSLERFRPRERQFSGIIGMLGNLIPIKRVYEVILAIYELNRNGNQFVLHLGGLPGQGADEERYYVAMKRIVSELQLEDKVFFDGLISDPAEYLKQIDIFISNSYWESQHLALQEAMATGCYCLAHFWDGVAEFLPRDNLFVTDREMREKIIAYSNLSESEKRSLCMGMRAIAEEKFDSEDTRIAMRQVIESAANHD